MFFDTHAHYDDGAFDGDREELMARLEQSGIELIVNPGCDEESSEIAIEIAERFSFVYAAVGFHPEELKSFSESGFEKISALAGREKCVAIGEIGLDYYWDAEHKQEQKVMLRRQIELALELDKPVIIHDREAHGDILDIIRDYDSLRGVFHCFSGSAEMAEELLKRGWYLGFDGPVTYKNARKALEVLERCPMDRLLLETDSPYLSPVPLRGKRNDSANLKYVAEAIGEIKGCSAQSVAAAALDNGKRLFGI